MESNTDFSSNITKYLSNLLTLKYKYLGEDLIREVASFDWKPAFDLNHEEFFSFLKQYEKKDELRYTNTESVSIWFPVNDNNNFRY